MKINLSEAIALFGLFSGLLSALWMAIGAYHANQRDLAHVKRNAEQAKLSFLEQGRSIDQLELDVKELLTIVNMLTTQSGQTYSGILGYKKRERP
jgi:hypothetical protein